MALVVRHELAGALAQRVELAAARPRRTARARATRGLREPRHQQRRWQPPYGKHEFCSSPTRSHSQYSEIQRSSVGRVGWRIVRRRHVKMRPCCGGAPPAEHEASPLVDDLKLTLSPGETSTAKSAARGVPNGGRKAAKEVVAERLANMISRSEIGRAVNARESAAADETAHAPPPPRTTRARLMLVRRRREDARHAAGCV